MSTESKPLATLCPEPLEEGVPPSNEELLAEAMELRALLMADARDDDTWGEIYRRSGGSFASRECAKEGEAWLLFEALANLRVLEHSIYQHKQAMKGECGDA